MEKVDNFQAKHAYIVYIHVMSIGDYPFPRLEYVRPNWHFLFKDKKCLSKFKAIYLSDVKNRTSSSKPFIRNLGSCSFQSRQARLELGRRDSKEAAIDIYSAIGNRTKHHDLAKMSYEDEEDFYYKPFGVELELKDQRMNHTYIELDRPLFLRAVTKSDTQAQGKLFVHIYPSGYIVLLLAVTLNWKKEKSLTEVNEFFRETRPWGTQDQQSQWRWISRLSKESLSLPQCIKLVKQYVQRSLFVDPSKYFIENNPKWPWYSAVQIVSDNAEQGQQVATLLFGNKTEMEALDIEHMKFNSLHGPSFQSWLVCSKRGLALIVDPRHKRKSALMFFWKVLILTEFTLLKKRIYEDYTRMLKSKIVELETYRRDLSLQIQRQNMLTFKLHTDIIQSFLEDALDKHILNASPFHRRIYSAISRGIGFDELRENLLQQILPSWKKEIDQWKPSLKRIWDTILSPLTSFLKSALK